MASLSYMKRLDEGLIEVQKIMKLFNGNRDNEYWSAINEIMDDTYRLQDRIREDMKMEMRKRKMKYVNKPVVVEAFQFGVDEYPEWFKGNSQISLHEDYPNCCKIITLEGVMEAWKYDMIIKGVKGEIYPCKKDIFDASYESFKE